VTTRSAGPGAEALIFALRAEGGTLADTLADDISLGESTTPPGPAQIAASGPRARGHEAEYELLVEMILEGSLLHYGRSRVVLTDDPDLALLLGDQLYALGLARLAALGDLAAVTELADVISLVAQAHGASDAELADAVWQAGAVAVGWGESDDHAAAKALVRAGDRRAREALLAAARRPSS
jgi:hypothetical protein